MRKLIYLLALLLIPTVASSQSLTPIIEETLNLGGGYYIAFFGYNNTYSTTQSQSIGSNNKFTPNPQDRGQPTSFSTGRRYNVFYEELTYGSNISWKLKTTTVSSNTKNVLSTISDGSLVMPSVGQQVTFTVKYYNYENSSLTGATLKDSLPPGLTFVSATNGGSYSNGSVNWSLGTVLKRDSGQVQVTLQVSAYYESYTSISILRGTMSSAKVGGVGFDNNSGTLITNYRDSSLIAYEDLKNSGWNDWDVNDFVASWKSLIEVNSTGGITKITYDYEALARGSSFDHTLLHKIALQGTSSSTLTVRDTLNNIVSAWSFTNQSNSGTFTVPIFQSTTTAIRGTGAFANTEHFQVGIIKGYKAKLEVTVNPALNTYLTWIANLSNSDPYIRTALNQNVHIASIAGSLGNTQNVDNNVDSTTVLYGYFLDLAYKAPFNWRWPMEGPTYAMWKAYPQFQSYILSGKNSYLTWFNNPDTTFTWNRRRTGTLDNSLFASGIETKLPYRFNPNADVLFEDSADAYFSSPKLVDLNNDNKLEVIIGNLDKKLYAYQSNGTQVPGFPVSAGGFIRSTPAIDKKLDGNFIIAFGCEDGKLYAVNQTGASLPGFPVSISSRPIKSSPVISDINSDGNKEIIVFSGDGKVYAYSQTGQSLTGFPVTVQTTQDQFGSIIIIPSPAVADINSDGYKEIIVVTTDSALKIINYQGTVTGTAQLNGSVYSTPQIIKLGATYRIITATSGGTVYNINHLGVVVTSRTFENESFVSSPVVVDMLADNTPDIIIGSMQGKIRSINALTMNPAWETNFAQEIIASPIIADINGDNSLDIVYGLMNGFLIPLSHEGNLMDDTTLQNAIVPFNSWLISSPAIGDVDNNGKLDIVAASFDKTIKTFEMPQTTSASKVLWAMFGGNINNTNVSPVFIKQISESGIPMEYKLQQNYPNPFNPSTKIQYSLPKSSLVKMEVFNMLGQKVLTIVNTTQTAGVYEVDLNLTNFASGMYFYKLETENFTDTKKMMLVK